MNKILISDKLSEAGINFLNEQPDTKVHIETGLNEDQLCQIIGEYDALLIRSSTTVTEKVLESGKNLKVVGRAGIGVDNIDIPGATARGIIVMNTPDANATTTAELAIAHMLSLSRNLPKADRSIREGKWERGSLMGAELAHKTLAIFGFGTIGRIVSQRGLGLRMRVIAHDPFVTDEIFKEYGVEPVSFDELIAQADYLTLHCPMNDKTRGIIGTDQIASMKNSARIINCARGGLIDEAALYEGLKSNHLAGAALDVYENEPPKQSPLLELDNIVFTPHLGASTHEAQVAVSVEIARQAITFLTTGEAINALNLPRMSAEELNKCQPFMKLANILGKMLANLATKPIERLEIALYGKASEAQSHPISVEALVGVLGEQLSIPVNRVNVVDLAKRQGISITESRTEETHDYLSLVRLSGWHGDEVVTVAGTLLGGCHPRLVNINQFEIEVVPEGTMLITEHDNQPGVIAALTTILADARVNISSMQVGSSDTDHQAMAVIGISEPLTERLLSAISAIQNVHKVTQIGL